MCSKNLRKRINENKTLNKLCRYFWGVFIFLGFSLIIISYFVGWGFFSYYVVVDKSNDLIENIFFCIFLAFFMELLFFGFVYWLYWL